MLVFVSNAWSLPTTCGTTGLLTQPTAQTLNSGNICVGLWSDNSEWEQTPANKKNATVVPFAITLGLGSFMEAYGSFPNVLFNDEETASGRGFAILGTKLRILGKRSSLLKFSIDGQFKRAVSMDPELDGLTDFLGRGILSLQHNRFGLHGWGGLLQLEENLSGGIGPFEDVTAFGGGIEFFPTTRLRVIAEADTYSEAILGTDVSGEWLAGFQYFISPHLTLSVGYGGGLSDISSESRVLVGLSSCQGIGTYSQIERKVLPPEEIETVEKNEPVKVLKIKTLSPLLSRSKPADASPATGHRSPLGNDYAEVVGDPKAPAVPVMLLPALVNAPPVDSPVEIQLDRSEEIMLDPSENISKADPFVQAVDKQPVSAIGPLSAPAPVGESSPVLTGETSSITASVSNETAVPPVSGPSASVVDVSNGKLNVASTLNARIITQKMSRNDKMVIEFPTRAKIYRKFLLPEFSFDTDQYSLSSEGAKALSLIAHELSKDDAWFVLRVDGHTDNTGSHRYNVDLSYRRAVEYAIHLVNKTGLHSGRVFIKGFGEQMPIATNSTKEGRAKNRRVELLALVPAE